MTPRQLATLAATLAAACGSDPNDEPCAVECQNGYECSRGKCVEMAPCWLPRSPDHPCPTCPPEKRQGNGCFVDRELVECGPPPPFCDSGPPEGPCWLPSSTTVTTEETACRERRYTDGTCEDRLCEPPAWNCRRRDSPNSTAGSEPGCGDYLEHGVVFSCPVETHDCSAICPEERRKADFCAVDGVGVVQCVDAPSSCT